mmetsp:Transcript_3947/g.10608  ORF Transcript_3947/g.10608 Transcript_3947/m.10608 type:complete len:223 (-) Transcript_3947:61-729(-)
MASCRSSSPRQTLRSGRSSWHRMGATRPPSRTLMPPRKTGRRRRRPACAQTSTGRPSVMRRTGRPTAPPSSSSTTATRTSMSGGQRPWRSAWPTMAAPTPPASFARSTPPAGSRSGARPPRPRSSASPRTARPTASRSSCRTTRTSGRLAGRRRPRCHARSAARSSSSSDSMVCTRSSAPDRSAIRTHGPQAFVAPFSSARHPFRALGAGARRSRRCFSCAE